MKHLFFCITLILGVITAKAQEKTNPQTIKLSLPVADFSKGLATPNIEIPIVEESNSEANIDIKAEYT